MPVQEIKSYDREIGGLEAKLSILEKTVDQNKQSSDLKIDTLKSDYDEKLNKIHEKIENKLKDINEKLDKQFTNLGEKVDLITHDRSFFRGMVKTIAIIFSIVIAVGGVLIKLYT